MRYARRWRAIPELIGVNASTPEACVPTYASKKVSTNKQKGRKAKDCDRALRLSPQDAHAYRHPSDAGHSG